jgi:hypothetical protein
LQQHHPELVAELEEALQRQRDDPWLSPHADRTALPAVQHRWEHKYRLNDIQHRMEAACREAGL